MSTRRTLTPFERAAVRVLVRMRGTGDVVPTRQEAAEAVSRALYRPAPGSKGDRISTSLFRRALNVVRLDGKVARETCARDYIESVVGDRFPPRHPHNQARNAFIDAETTEVLKSRFCVLAHAIVGACDSWIAELADGRVAVAVRTPNAAGKWKRRACRRCGGIGRIRRQGGHYDERSGGECRVCAGLGWVKREVARSGRWYRAAFPADARVRELLAVALRYGGDAWDVLGDCLAERGAVELKKWPKPGEWPAKWRIAPA